MRASRMSLIRDLVPFDPESDLLKSFIALIPCACAARLKALAYMALA